MLIAHALLRVGRYFWDWGRRRGGNVRDESWEPGTNLWLRLLDLLMDATIFVIVIHLGCAHKINVWCAITTTLKAVISTRQLIVDVQVRLLKAPLLTNATIWVMLVSCLITAGCLLSFLVKFRGLSARDSRKLGSVVTPATLIGLVAFYRLARRLRIISDMIVLFLRYPILGGHIVAHTISFVFLITFIGTRSSLVLRAEQQLTDWSVTLRLAFTLLSALCEAH